MTENELPNFDELWDFSAPKETEAAFRKLEGHYRDIEDQDWRLQLRTQIARAMGLERRFDEARGVLDEVAEELADGQNLSRVRYLLEIGRVENSSGNPGACVAHFQEAWQGARNIGDDGLAVDAAHMLAIVEEAEESLQWHEKAMNLAMESSQPGARKWLPSLSNNLGWTYHDMGRFEDALSCFRTALELREQAGQDEEVRIANWCVGRCLRSLERFEDALAIQRKLLAQYDSLGQPSGYVHEELGELLLVKKGVEEARPHFRRAFEVLSADDWLVANESARIERLRALGE